MHLDVHTLIVVTVFISAMAGVLMGFSWLQNRGVTALLYWSAAYLAGAVAAGLIGARGHIPDVYSIVVANTVLLAASGLTWSGLRNFDGRPVLAWQTVAGSVAWLAACAIPAFSASIHDRGTLSSAIAAGYAALSIWELWRSRQDGLRSRWLAMAVLGFHGTVYLLRIPLIWMIAPPAGGGLLQLQWLPAGIFEALFYAFVSAFVLLSMAKERAEVRHKQAAFIDPLTGVPNRRGFGERAAKVLAHCRAEQRPVAVLLFDLDHFKRINDTFGHQIGDDILVRFCRIAQGQLGAHDIFARLGGEEFACLLADTAQAAGFAVAERIRRDFEALQQTVHESRVHATVSIGMANSVDAGSELTRLLGAADKALYRAKAKGRNRVEGRRPALSVVPGTVASDPTPLGAA